MSTPLSRPVDPVHGPIPVPSPPVDPVPPVPAPGSGSVQAADGSTNDTKIITSGTPTVTSQASQSGSLLFPAVYYGAPVSQSVDVALGSTRTMTVIITSGSPYFTVASSVIQTTVGSLPVTPAPAPAIVPTEQNIGRATVTVSVSEGFPLQPGPITGTLEITYAREGTPGPAMVTETFTLEATFYGTIIGEVSVTPPTVRPGQPVQIEVLNTLGKPISDPAVNVTVQGVPGNSRWEQYATAGTRTLFAIASNGAITETATASVAVTGTPMVFTLDPPSTTQLPIIQAATVPGLPYAGSFTLGTPQSISGALATSPPVAAPAAAEQAAAAGPRVTVAQPVAVTSAPGRAVTGVLPPVALVETSYTWNFGDGSAPVTTQSAAVTHDFFPAVTGDAVIYSFDVSCTAVHDNVTVQRTIVLHSAYGICKRMGVAVPPITGAPAYAPLATISLSGLAGGTVTIPLNGFSASMIVHNLEPLPMDIQSVAIVPMSDTAGINPPAPQFTSMSTMQTIAANSASALGTFVPFSALSLGGPPANAFTLYYLGTMTDPASGTATPVRFSVVFRISAMYSGATTSTSVVAVPVWDRQSSLEVLTRVTAAKSGGTAVADANLDAATRTITVPLAANANDVSSVAQATSTVQTGLASIAAAAAPASTAHDDLITINPDDPPPVAPGAVCYPDDISDADAASAAAQQLVCQLTSGPPQTVTIPSAFQNAQAGDVILSPAPAGDGDLIAALFGALTPSQHHGHSGIMTANFYEITHCTASSQRIGDNLNTDAAGIPTSLNSQVLQYGWPGSVTQSIDEATNSVPWTAPEGKVYYETSFNFDDRGGPGEQLIPPLVVKPMPENEQTARPLLRQAADLARSKGARYGSQYDSTGGTDAGQQLSQGGCYYSFYNYTKPQISAGFTDPASAAGGWAQGLSPAVCSAFVWMCMKETGIPCVSGNATETLSDFTAQALATGEVAVSPDPGNPTLDGLIYYSQEERQAGANALYHLFMEEALDQEDGFGSIPGINDAVAGPIADQLLNCFAFGDPTMVGESNWQNPGAGNAVSPDNIELWSPPYFGYLEPLQYLPSHTDQYTPSVWTRVTTYGTISGTVTRSDTGAPVSGALVWANLNVAGMYAYSGADGSYTLTSVPLGTYALKASATLPVGSSDVEFTNNQGVDYTLTSANDGNGVQDLVISPPQADFRQVKISYQVSGDHSDANPFDPQGTETLGYYNRSLFVNPGQMTQQLTYTFNYANGGYYKASYTFYVALLEDQQTIQYSVEGVLTDDNGSNVQDQGTAGPYTVPPGETFTGASLNNLSYSQPGYENGPVNFTWNIANTQQTG